MRWVVAYDVRSDHRRARVAATLAVWGDRIQQSVWVIDAEPAEFSELMDRARSLLAPASDGLVAFRQCADCDRGAVWVGQAGPDEDDPWWIV